jgi:hypothetical protein
VSGAAILIGSAIVWTALMVWSLRKYWRTSDDSREAGIYRDAKFWCLFVTVGLALLLPQVVALSGIS